MSETATEASASSAEIESRLAGLRGLVGNTPLLAIEVDFRGVRRTVHAKAESLNMTGSVKDRMALHILEAAYREGQEDPWTGRRAASVCIARTHLELKASITTSTAPAVCSCLLI